MKNARPWWTQAGACAALLAVAALAADPAPAEPPRPADPSPAVSEKPASAGEKPPAVSEKPPDAPWSPAAFFARGEALLAVQDRESALECYDQALKLRPDLDLLRKTLERKYQIGLDYLEGRASRYFLGFIAYSSPAFGVKILDELVRDYPYESFSDDALYSIANHYARNENWEECRPVYERLIAMYPRSEFVPEAYFQLGTAIYHGIKSYRCDPTPIVRARWHFERYLEKRDVGSETKRARERIEELKNMEASYELYVARFYLGDDNVKGARIHLSAAVRKGRSLDGKPLPAAREAEEALKSLPGEK